MRCAAGAAATVSTATSTPVCSPKGAVHVRTEQAEHRLLPRPLGRRLVLQQGDRAAPGGGTPGDRRPVRPRHARGRRRHRHPNAGPRRQSRHPRRPLLRRIGDHRRRHRRSRRRAGLHRRARAGRRRDLPEPAGPVPHHRRLRAHRGRRRTHLVAPRRRRMLRRRPPRGGAAARLGDPLRARRRPVRPQRRGGRVAIEAQLVHRGQQRPHRPSGARALRRRAHGRHHLRASTAATSPCSPTPTWCSTSSARPPTQSRAPRPPPRCRHVEPRRNAHDRPPRRGLRAAMRPTRASRSWAG